MIEPRTIAGLNAQLAAGTAQVRTATEYKTLVQSQGLAYAAAHTHIVTAGTFEPMESCGAFVNLGHTDPPIRLQECRLQGVPVNTGLGAVDIYIGATQEAPATDAEAIPPTGAQVIADLIAGHSLPLIATGRPNDLYPRADWETTIAKDTVNQFYLWHPRGLYQNFIVGVNSSEQVLHTYLGPLLPRLGNAVYGNPGAIAPLWNDPQLRAIGIGTRIFLGGGIGYIAWEGTQHFPLQKRLANQTPVGPAATLALMGDAKTMGPEWVRPCYFRQYGPALAVGVAVPIPLLDADLATRAAVSDADIVAPIVDFSIPRRVRPSFGTVSYAQLRSGKLEIQGKTVRTAPLASRHLAEQAAHTLKQWLLEGQFTLTEPVTPLPGDRPLLSQG
ncbi:MAG TPA: hypothetical protein DCQ32_00205 [Cyanobacteria bacterium UBA8156]|jgi:uncharacterized protein (DUF39 family)|nr:hypothetical protein [Cyanobacteria bacterium UBA8156]